jgi:hypothetical protein
MCCHNCVVVDQEPRFWVMYDDTDRLSRLFILLYSVIWHTFGVDNS